ncbi:hypothetical protein BDV12DRAFT_167595 [Aspergillus spectabilis]
MAIQVLTESGVTNAVSEMVTDPQRERKFAEAYAQLRLLFFSKEKALGSTHEETIRVMCDIGDTLTQSKRLAEAETMFSEAHQRATSAFGPHDVRALSACVNVCWDHHARGQLNPLEGLVMLVIGHYTGQEGLRNKRTADVFAGFGAIYDGRGNIIDGERYSSTAYEIYADVLGPGHGDTIVTGMRLDRLRRELGQLMDRLKREHRLETRQEALIEASEAAILHGIKEKGEWDLQLLYAHAGLYKTRFHDTGRRSYLDTAIRWLETAIELLDSDALSREQWLSTISVYRLQTGSRL